MMIFVVVCIICVVVGCYNVAEHKTYHGLLPGNVGKHLKQVSVKGVLYLMICSIKRDQHTSSSASMKYKDRSQQSSFIPT